MADRVDGASAAMRYSRTSLYGKSGKHNAQDKNSDMMPELREGQTYSDIIREHLQMYTDESMRTKLAMKVKNELQRHYKATKDPIVVWTEHPLSGVSWLKILKFVITGDVKNRQAVGTRVNNAKALRLVSRYHEELNKAIREGKIDAYK